MGLQDARHGRNVKKVKDVSSNNMSFADAISKIEHYNKQQAENEAENDKENAIPISEQLGIKDDAYTIPVEKNDVPHLIATIACIAVPLIMLIGAFLASGLKAFLNWRLILIIPTVAILYFLVRATNGLGRVDVKDIEREYPDLVIVDDTDDSDDPQRPKFIQIRTYDEANANFTVVMRNDWENNMTNRRLEGILVVKNGKAAVMIENR